jgi:hypothetical protein
MLPERARDILNLGILGGLVMDQSEAGWRKASKRHLAWLWNIVNTLEPQSARTRYRTLIIKIVKVTVISVGVHAIALVFVITIVPLL